MSLEETLIECARGLYHQENSHEQEGPEGRPEGEGTPAAGSTSGSIPSAAAGSTHCTDALRRPSPLTGFSAAGDENSARERREQPRAYALAALAAPDVLDAHNKAAVVDLAAKGQHLDTITMWQQPGGGEAGGTSIVWATVIWDVRCDGLTQI